MPFPRPETAGSRGLRTESPRDARQASELQSLLTKRGGSCIFGLMPHGAVQGYLMRMTEETRFGTAGGHQEEKRRIES